MLCHPEEARCDRCGCPLVNRPAGQQFLFSRLIVPQLGFDYLLEMAVGVMPSLPSLLEFNRVFLLRPRENFIEYLDVQRMLLDVISREDVPASDQEFARLLEREPFRPDDEP